MKTFRRLVVWGGSGLLSLTVLWALVNVGLVVPAVLVGLFLLLVGVAYALDD